MANREQSKVGTSWGATPLRKYARHLHVVYPRREDILTCKEHRRHSTRHILKQSREFPWVPLDIIPGVVFPYSVDYPGHCDLDSPNGGLETIDRTRWVGGVVIAQEVIQLSRPGRSVLEKGGVNSNLNLRIRPSSLTRRAFCEARYATHSQW
jgi:hypothetical protein